MEEESADKVTVVLAAAAVVAAAAAEGSGDMLPAGPVGAGCVPVAAAGADRASVVAVKRVVEAPASILGSWTGPVIQGEPGSSAAAEAGWGDPAAGGKETDQTAVLKLGNKVAETVGALVMGLAVAPGTEGACGAADRAALPGCVGQKLVEGGAALDMMSVRPVVLVGAGCRAPAAGLGEEPGQAGRSMVSGSETHNLLVPAVHRIPSEQNIHIPT